MSPSNSGSSQRLRGRRALVTGAASSIGLAVVRRFLAEGAAVVMSDARPEALETARASFDPRPHAAACDVGREDDVRNAVAEMVATPTGIMLRETVEQNP